VKDVVPSVNIRNLPTQLGRLGGGVAWGSIWAFMIEKWPRRAVARCEIRTARTLQGIGSSCRSQSHSLSGLCRTHKSRERQVPLCPGRGPR